MLGDGIVSFGVCSGAATDCRYANASPKIVSDEPDPAVDVQRRRRELERPRRVAELHVERLVDCTLETPSSA